MAKLPTLAHTVEWMVPLIWHLHDAQVPARPWQKQLAYRVLRQPFAMTLTDVPIKSKSKIMPFYYAREAQLAAALTQALGDEWLVKSARYPAPNSMRWDDRLINGRLGDLDVLIHPDMCVMLYDQSNGQFLPGITHKSGAQYSMCLHAHRFPDESHKNAYLICQ